MKAKTEHELRRQYHRLRPSLDERARREWAGSEAAALGVGGIALVHRASGLSRTTIARGMRELDEAEREREGTAGASQPRRVRRAGAGRPTCTQDDPALLDALDALVEPGSRGDPESPLRWTIKSLRTLARELCAQGHPISFPSVGRLLKQLGYSLQGNRKSIEGRQHPDRDAQFQHIARECAHRIAAGQPVLSVDTKKKELIGPYRNAGKAYRPQGMPEKVKTHDFPGEAGKVSPYGVYDIADNEGWVSVGISADTAEFAVHSLRRWWEKLGCERYDPVEGLYLTADGGGSNSYRTRLWKWELQGLADELDIPISVSHFPPGTSKWNRIEHRLFSFISLNWRGQPLHDYRTVVELIGSTRTEAGLQVHCELDENHYEKGRKISDEDMRSINLHPHEFHGEWNYTIKPREIAT